jgi:LacI family gluconate utilization system Gnt-I transcriptional repressor
VVQISGTGVRAVDMSIGIDHRAGGMLATRHLLEAGYTRIGIIGGVFDARARSRLAGYRSVLEEAGLFDPHLVVSEDTPSSIHLGCKLLRRLLDTTPDVDAVFCHNDDVALGVMFECQRLGIRIPEDFGVCGFNDLDFAAVTEPPLTTIRVPRFEIGYRATDMLIRRAGGEEVASHVVDLDYKLITRQSTRRFEKAAGEEFRHG